jgi:hypothetical protein
VVVASAVRALEAERGEKMFRPAAKGEISVVLDARPVDREGSSRRRGEKGKQRAASVSLMFEIPSDNLLTVYLGYVG